tara:strand:- start:130 stop:621 length:492 start_codon:yes stop_codon:yes gene_type:complete
MSIYAKLLKVQTEVGAISKDSKNPFFKSKYFDINSLISHVQPLLSENGLLLLQPIKDGKQYSIIIDTETGESVESSLELPNISDAQKLGSAITYYRRYTLQSLLGLQAEDDDANLASQKPNRKPALTTEQFEKTLNADAKGIKAVLDRFRMSDDQRKQLNNKL